MKKIAKQLKMKEKKSSTTSVGNIKSSIRVTVVSSIAEKTIKDGLVKWIKSKRRMVYNSK